MNILTVNTDGSYQPKLCKTIVGWGFTAQGLVPTVDITYGIIDDAEIAKEYQFGGELNAAIMAIIYAKAKGYDGITINHDYNGVAEFVVGKWRAKSKSAKMYVKWYQESVLPDNKFVVEFRKIPREYNEAADEIAKQAIQEAVAKGGIKCQDQENQTKSQESDRSAEKKQLKSSSNTKTKKTKKPKPS